MTAREPSAVEVIAEALRKHQPVPGRSQFEADRCITCDLPVMFHHGAAEALAALKAAGVVVATREDLAEVWDDGAEMGHEWARAVNPEWPAQPLNPYRSEP